MAFGLTLLVASMFFHGGKDTDHGHDTAAVIGWAPVTSIRFWVFFFTFGGGAGYALVRLEGETVAAIGAVGIGWVSGAMAVTIIRALTKRSVSSAVDAKQLVGTTGTLLLPVGPGKPGKVRIALGDRAEDYVANVVDDGGDLPSGSSVLIVAEGDLGSLLVTKHEM
ncbi:MAG: hypothetical protein JO257_19860 [Deltaproteobacteria bacterium]|nr:hypothetical protein [Deltaproteobacteria bacterium]